MKIGKYCVIEEDVIVGDNVVIGHHCTLKSGTIIGNNVNLGDYVKTTGLCYIGNNVNVRTDSCISKGVIVEDNVFVGGGVMSSHTRFPAHRRTQLTRDMGKQYVTRIGYGSLIGSCVCLGAGVNIVPNTIVGYGSLVLKDISECGVYIGRPAKKISEVPKGWKIKPSTFSPFMFSEERIKKYLPKA